MSDKVCIKVKKDQKWIPNVSAWVKKQSISQDITIEVNPAKDGTIWIVITDFDCDDHGSTINAFKRMVGKTWV